MAQLRAELAQLKNARRAANGAPTTPTPRRKAELVAAVRELKGLPPPAPPPPPPERRRLPNALSAYNVTLESATRLFSLPRKLGAHPELGGEMVAKLGPKSGYVEHNKSYFWLAEPDDAYTVTTAQAAAIVTELGERRAQRPQRRGRVIVARGGRGATSAAAKAPATPATPAAPVPEADPAPVAAPRSRAKAKAPAAQARAGAASPTAAKRAASPAKPAASKVKGSKSRATATPPP
jgi:topoisomerase IA-like protein